MVEYATTPNKCRSRMLLYYFGEKNEHDCGQCDVCLSNHPIGVKRKEFNDVKLLLDNMLDEFGEVSLLLFGERVEAICSKDKAVEVLTYLQAEEEIVLYGEMIRRK